ncbi:hypothetical protein TL16_g13368, partial [Triparma laevis f. inornata]
GERRGGMLGKKDESLKKDAITEFAAAKAREEAAKRQALRNAQKAKLTVRVKATFWGKKYTAEVWAGVVSVLMALPKEILMLDCVNVGGLLIDMFLSLAYVQGKGALELTVLQPVQTLLKRWRRVNGVGLNEYLGGYVGGLSKVGRRRWAVLKELGLGGIEIFGCDEAELVGRWGVEEKEEEEEEVAVEEA